jgi:hypothetical protein
MMPNQTDIGLADRLRQQINREKKKMAEWQIDRVIDRLHVWAKSLNECEFVVEIDAEIFFQSKSEMLAPFW